jgi:alkylated DNA repair protein (DNA oxidative demethylase)
MALIHKMRYNSLMNGDLFDLSHNGETWTETITEGALILRQYAVAQAPEIIAAIETVTAQSPFRHIQTPGGYTMSAAITCCGDLGWVSSPQGYRYARHDPQTGYDWPTMPTVLREIGQQAAREAGYPEFHPDSCMINRYAPASKMSLHQDRHEQDLSAPIVSVSLGVPAMFLFGGLQRSDKTIKVPLAHGDVVVWGGVSRLCFHGVLPIKADYHPMLGQDRINITFRVVRKRRS